MALEGAEWGAVAGVFVVVLAMMVYNQMVAKRNAAKPAAEDAPGPGDFLSRFVVHDGDVVGEVVARNGDHLIVKHQGMFRAVPVAQTRISNDEVHVRGELDLKAAEAAGTAWLESNRKGQHDDISAHLTRSEDVKKPAFEAFQSRRKEVEGDEEE